MGSLASAVMKMLPRGVRHAIGEFRRKQRFEHFARKTRAEAFDEVYTRGLWDNAANNTPSGEGSYGEWAEHYISFIKDYISVNKVETVLDIGTGDFNIGSRIQSFVVKYIGADVSSVIIDRNRAKYGHLRNVTFVTMDACVDELPVVDLILCRQVLQHLSNSEVELALLNLERSKAKGVIIVEHMLLPSKVKAPNIDLGSHGPHLRTLIGSGLFLELPPFSRAVSRIGSCEYRDGETLVYYLLKPN